MSVSRPTPTDDQLPAAVGEVIGGYRLDAVIGHGGMGCVYSGTHARLGRKAAIKVLKRAYAADTEYVSRFIDEARVVNAIRHPNIIDIFDFIETAEPLRVACIMELLEGPTLREWLKRQPLELSQAVNLTLQLADALRKVHAINVVHRDLKPDNLVVVGPVDSDLSSVPSLKVLDFGIAKVQVAGAERTTPGLVLGTPAYMSPEQVSGQKVSPASDVYSLGTVFYEMLASRRLFLGEPMTIFRQKLMGEIPPVELPKGLPEAERIAALIKRCVAFEKERRVTLSEIEAELRGILSAASGTKAERSKVSAKPTLARAETQAYDPGPTQAMPTPPPAQTPAQHDTVATFQGDLVTGSPPRRLTWLAGAVAVAVLAGTALGVALSRRDVVVLEPMPLEAKPNPERPTSGTQVQPAPEAPTPAPTTAAPAPSPTSGAPAEAARIEAALPAADEEPAPSKDEAASGPTPTKTNPKKKAEAPAPKKGDKKVLRRDDRPLEQRPDKQGPLKKDDMVPW